MDSLEPEPPSASEARADLPYLASAADRPLVSALLACTSDLVLIIDLDRRCVLDCNDRATRLLGLTSGAPDASQIHTWLIEPDLDQLVRQATHGATDRPTELTLRCLNREQAPLALRMRLLSVTLGERSCLVLMGQVDQPTDHPANGTASTASQERLSLALSGANDGLFDWDFRTNEVYYSPQWCRMLGYADGELAQHISTWERLVDPDDRDRAAAALDDYIAGRRPSLEVEFRMCHKDGHWVHVLARAQVERDAQGTPIRLVGTHFDLSERKRIEASLREREARFRSLVESIETGYVFYRQQPDGSFEYISSSIEPILGYPAETFEANKARAMTDNPINAAAAVATSAGLLGAQQAPFEVEMRHQSGALRRLRISEYPVLDESGQVTALQGIAQDVTDAWRNRALLDARNQLLERIIHGQPLEQALETLTHGIEALEPKMRCSILRFDPEQRRLFGLVVSSLPRFYAEAVEGVQVHPELGSCGAAACTGQRVVTTNILEHPYWAPFRELMERTPLRACWSEPIKGRGGQVLGTFAMYFDEVREPTENELNVIASAADLAALAIQQRRDAEALMAAEERARLLLDSSHEGIFGLDLEGRISFINPAAATMLGYPVEALLGQTPSALLRHSQADGTPFGAGDCPLHRAATEGIEHRANRSLFYCHDGRPLPIECKAAPIRKGGHADGAVVSFHDIGERLEHERRIEFLAFHDALTGLANRRLFTERLAQSLARYRRTGERFALLLLDLDRFKEINDRLGHPTGDRVLCAIAGRVGSLLREVDLFARLGGDEFAVIQPDVVDTSDATRLADRILRSLDQELGLGSISVSSGSSIGITLPRPGTLDPAELMQQADIALYEAKDAGRGVWAVFEPR